MKKTAYLVQALIRATGFEVGVRLYSLNRKANIAPMGLHHQIGLMAVPYQVEDLDGFFAGRKNRFGFLSRFDPGIWDWGPENFSSLSNLLLQSARRLASQSFS